MIYRCKKRAVDTVMGKLSKALDREAGCYDAVLSHRGNSWFEMFRTNQNDYLFKVWYGKDFDHDEPIHHSVLLVRRVRSNGEKRYYGKEQPNGIYHFYSSYDSDGNSLDMQMYRDFDSDCDFQCNGNGLSYIVVR